MTVRLPCDRLVAAMLRRDVVTLGFASCGRTALARLRRGARDAGRRAFALEARAMLFDALIAGYVRANASRALATVLAIALGVAVAVAAALAERTVTGALGRDVAALDDGASLRVSANAGALDERVLARVEDVDGVALARPIVEGTLVLGASPQDPNAGELVRTYGVDLLQPLPGVAASGLNDPGAFAPSGSIATATAIEGKGIVVSQALAAQVHLALGASVEALVGARFVKLRVAAILPSAAVGVDRFTAFVDLATAQPLFGEIGRLDRIDVVPAGDPALVRARIAAVLPASARVEGIVPRAGALSTLGTALVATLAVLALLALLAGALLAYDAVASSVVRRRAEVGTLRALGVTRGAIFRTFVAEGALYGTAGALIGLELGAFGARSLLQALLSGSDAAIGSLDVVYDWSILAIVPACGVLAAGAAAALAARGALAIAPAFASTASGFERPRSTTIVRRCTAIAALASALAISAAALGAKIACDIAVAIACAFAFAPLVAFASAAVVRIARVRRAPKTHATIVLASLGIRSAERRTSVAVASLALAFAAAISLLTAGASLRVALDTWAAQTFRGDILVRALAGDAHASLAPGAVARATAVPGVARFAFSRATSVAYDDGTLRVRGEGTDLADLDAPGAEPHVARTPAPAIVSARFAAHRHLGVGAALLIPSPSGAFAVSVAAVRPDFAETNDALAIGARDYVRRFGDRSVDTLALTLAPGADLARVRRAVVAAFAPQRLDIRSTREERARALGVFDRTFSLAAGIGILVLLLAVGGVANALSAFVLERRRELAMLRYVGATRGVVRAMMLGQATFVGVLGTACGLCVGLVFAFVQCAVVDPTRGDEPIALQIPLGLVALATFATIGAALAASIRPANLAARIAAEGARGGER